MMPTHAEDLIDNLVRDFDAQKAALLASALSGRVAASPEFDAELSRLGITPLSTDERETHAAKGAPLKKGVLPFEVRKALQALKEQFTSRAKKADSELDKLSDEGSDNALAENKLSRFETDLVNFIESEMSKYLAAVRATVSMGGIFANAKSSAARYAGMSGGAGLHIVKCKSCGAARPADVQLETCEFCGGSFF
jgi:hypothetical protein